jgi:hypothetical protein
VGHHHGDALEPTPEDCGDQYDGKEGRCCHVEQVSHRRPDRPTYDHRHDEDAQGEEQGHHPGALPPIGTHQANDHGQEDEEERQLQEPLQVGDGV